MFTHPVITTDLATQNRRELTAQADARALARAARPARPGRVSTARRVVASLAIASATAAVLMTSPVGVAHSGADHHFAHYTYHYRSHYGTHNSI
jgi:choline dehydrogenase-like flavoprotein